MSPLYTPVSTGLLAYVSYEPGSQTTITLSSSTLTAIDATNLVVPDFVAPSSGRVLVICSAPVNLPNAITRWGLLDSGGSTVSASQEVIGNGNAIGGYLRFTYTKRIAVTAGATITGWKWAHAASAGSTLIRIEANDAATITVLPA